MGSLAGELQVSSISDSDLSMVCVLLLRSLALPLVQFLRIVRGKIITEE